MTVKIKQKGSLGSVAEDLFVELFCRTECCEHLFNIEADETSKIIERKINKSR